MSHEVDRGDVADVLDRIASFMELKGEDAFRIRAFRTAARTIATFPRPLPEALADGSLVETKGIGPATLQIVDEVAATGHSSLLEELREQVPPGLVEMLAISGLGVAKIRQIHESLDIDSLPELEAAAMNGRLAALPRFGDKTASNILKSIAYLRRASTARLSHHAREEAEALVLALQAIHGIVSAHVAGEVRRGLETVQDIVLVVVAEIPPADVFERLDEVPGLQEIAGRDERWVTLRFTGGSTVRVVVTTPVNAGAVLLQATGSPAHLQRLGRYATERGYALSGGALWHGSQFVPTPDEETVYRVLCLDPIPPELREGDDEVEEAASGRLPVLIQPEELKGLLHCHSRSSDGSSTIQELAVAARDLGYTYLGITDHSQSAALAGGLAPDLLGRQAAEIREVNARVEGIRVLQGVEIDILVDGRLDYEDRVMADLDFVIGSVHTRFNMSREEMTARMLAAMDSPYLNIIGHPTGRLLLARKPYPLDLEAVFAKAAECGVAFEINADPHRLDLDWRHLKLARQLGVPITIGADAHSVAGIANVAYGVRLARKGRLRAQDIVNTRTIDEFLDFVARRRAA